MTDQGFGQFTVDPAKAGSNAIHVIVTGLDGTAPCRGDGRRAAPARARPGPIEVPMTKPAAGHYVNDDATIPFPGTWTITGRTPWSASSTS